MQPKSAAFCAEPDRRSTSEAISHLERQVIALSRSDPVSSLRQAGRLSRWIFGRNVDFPPLADPKLEALRRYAILRRVYGERLDTLEVEKFQKAGFVLEKQNNIDFLIRCKK